MTAAVPPFETFYEAHKTEVLRFLVRRLGRDRAEPRELEGSGFFVVRSSLLPFETFRAWSKETDRSELRLDETDDLYSHMLRLVRPSNRSPLRRLLDSRVARGLKVGVERLETSSFRFNEILMSGVGLRDRAVRQFILAGIQAESVLRKRL